ncbi:TPA: NTP transferase domain-containing protein [Morganella morganii]|jgi:CTP:phosphocholine cytidylyltransferase-like protein|uniref:NTP transferase domain-containing protein n=1 Tax=Morganella morganii TaxID=582 RepID=A0AAN5MIV2_MORMO|nr:NTP transferase domain-containing protein [Morganella morganii]HED3889849.1 NTP transferase domain-containing protein [Morganella morganii]
MNAVILAAGLGSRFGDITKKTHKALLPIGGIPNIERTIQYLSEFGITEIIIVTGHLAHQFEYLKEKYGCTLIHNEYYEKYNNIYSFLKIADYFSDTLVIDADVVLLKNIFIKSEHSLYYTVKRKTPEYEWIPVLDNNGYIERIDIREPTAPSLLGISYWKSAESKKILAELPKFSGAKNLNNSKLYWDNIPMSMIHDLNMKTYEVSSDVAGEMDDIENYNSLVMLYNN